MKKRLPLARMKRIRDRIMKALQVDPATAALIAAILTGAADEEGDEEDDED